MSKRLRGQLNAGRCKISRVSDASLSFAVIKTAFLLLNCAQLT